MTTNKVILLIAMISCIVCSIIGLAVLNQISLSNQRKNNEELSLKITKNINFLFSRLKGHAESLGTLSQEIETAQGTLKPDNPYVLPALQTTKDQLDASIVYLMNKEGNTVACTPYGTGLKKTLTGKNYQFRPYFTEAIKGRSSVYIALGVTTGKRGIYYSAPVRDVKTTPPCGAVVLKKGFTELDNILRSYGDNLFLLVSKDGIVIAATENRYIYKTTLPIAASRLDEIRKSKQFANQPLLPMTFFMDKEKASIGFVEHDIIKHSTSIKGWNIYSVLPTKGAYPYFSAIIVIAIIFLLNSLCSLYVYSSLHRKKLKGEVEKQNVELLAFNKDLKREIEKQKMTQKELIKAKEDAIIASNAKSQFLANMSHEIRTPMNGIIGMGELLLETNMKQEQREYAATMMLSAESLMTILNDILDFSKIEAGKLDIEYITLNLMQLTDSVGQLMAVKAEEKGIDLFIKYTPDTPEWVLGDSARLRQILVNLIGNAIKFTNKGYVMLEVHSLKKDQDTHIFEFNIKDTGIGIEEDVLKKIFDKFTQADASTTRKFGGTGLGLSITKQLIEIMDGEISVQSELKKGSTFSFSMPMSPQEVTVNTDSIDFQNFTGLRILIIDDIELNRQIFSDILSKWGCIVDEATTPGEALKIIEKEKYDIVISDFQLPEMNGLELGKKIRHSKNTDDNLIMIILSSFSASKHEKKLFEKEFDDFLTKPVRQSQIRNCLTRLLATKGNYNLTKTQASSEMNKRKRKKTSEEVKVLLVEDNIINQKLAEKILLKLDCIVDKAENGEICLKKVEENKYDIIFMDCQMPEMNGFDATIAIRGKEKENKAKPVPIVAMTANAMPGDKEACIEVGMNDYLSKPIKKYSIQEIIEKYCRNN